MRKNKIIINLVLVFLFVSCFGGPISNVIKLRNNNKVLGFVCATSMEKPGVEERVISGFDGNLTYSLDDLYGEWTQDEIKRFEVFAENHCRKVYSMLKDSLKYNTIEYVDLNKVPEAESQYLGIGKIFKYKDFGKTKYDYIWSFNFNASKSAKPIESLECNPGKEFPEICINFNTGIKAQFVFDDWSSKDFNKRRYFNWNPNYLNCGENTFDITKYDIDDVDDSELFELSEAIMKRCEKDSERKIAEFQNEIDKLNSR